MSSKEDTICTFVKKIPTTSISPTFKLTLPSDIAAATLESFLSTTFDLREARSQLSWPVSISRRRNKDKYEYLLMGWRGVCENLDVRCGDLLEFNVFSAHMEFTVTRIQQKGDTDLAYTPSLEDLQRRQSSSSSQEQHNTQLPYGETFLPEEPDINYNLDYFDDERMSPEIASAVPCDHLLGLILGNDTESGSKTSASPSLSSPMEQRMAAVEAAVDNMPGFEGGSWGMAKTEPSWGAGPERTPSRQEKGLKRKSDCGHASSTNKRPYSVSPSHSNKSNQHCHGSLPQRSYGYPADSIGSGMMSYNSGRCHPYELDELRAELRKERERASEAEARHAKLLYDLSGAESLLERHTTRGLLAVGQVFKAVNRLVSRDVISNVSLPVAQELSAYQIHLKDLCNDVLHSLWHMRGLTQLKDVPAMHVAHTTLPSAYKRR